MMEVHGEGLFLVHWEGERIQIGYKSHTPERFTLNDGSGRCLWAGDERDLLAQVSPDFDADSHDGRLDSDHPGSFLLYDVKGGTVRRFALRKAEDGWEANLTEQESIGSKRAKEQDYPQFTATLERSYPLGNVWYPDENDPEGFGYPKSVGFDPQGNLIVLSIEKDETQLVSRTWSRKGEVLRTRRMPRGTIEWDSISDLVPKSRDRWIGPIKGETGSNYACLDFQLKRVEPLDAPPLPAARSYPQKDGSEVRVLAGDDESGTKIQWIGIEGSIRAEGEFAQNGNGWVTGRSTSGETIMLHGLRTDGQGSGAWIRWSGSPPVPELHTLPRLDPRLHEVYWRSIHQNLPDSFWLYGDRGFDVPHSLLVQVAMDGTVLRWEQPHGADGFCFPPMDGSPILAPDGTFWSVEPEFAQPWSPVGESLVSFGILDLRGKRDAGADVTAWWIDGRGGALVWDDARSVSKFDSAGKLLNRSELPWFSEWYSPCSYLAEDGDGVIWQQMGPYGAYLRWDAQGQFLDVAHLRDWEEPVRFYGTGPARWQSDRSVLERVGPGGAIVQSVAKRPDGAWWRLVENFATSPDGTRLAATDTCGRGGEGEGAIIAVFDFRSGETWQVDLPGDWNGYSPNILMAGDWIQSNDLLMHFPSRRIWRKDTYMELRALEEGPRLVRLQWSEMANGGQKAFVEVYGLPE
ncbi:MAG: hypothetical protein R3F17_01965 [Planctomycetota bacterium]